MTKINTNNNKTTFPKRLLKIFFLIFVAVIATVFFRLYKDTCFFQKGEFNLYSDSETKTLKEKLGQEVTFTGKPVTLKGSYHLFVGNLNNSRDYRICPSQTKLLDEFETIGRAGGGNLDRIKTTKIKGLVTIGSYCLMPCPKSEVTRMSQWPCGAEGAKKELYYCLELKEIETLD